MVLPLLSTVSTGFMVLLVLLTSLSWPLMVPVFIIIVLVLLLLLVLLLFIFVVKTGGEAVTWDGRSGRVRIDRSAEWRRFCGSLREFHVPLELRDRS